MKKGKWISIILSTVLFTMLLPVSGCTPKGAVQMDDAVLRDKIAGGVMGHVGGLLSGFEFVPAGDGSPMVPLPDSWYQFLHGPYGYGQAHGGAGQTVVFDGEVAGDDDYHIDFFNQLIMDECGIVPDRKAIADKWVEYEVSDWGGGFCGYGIAQGFEIPPFTGLYEYGNVWHWCTEAYIENETLGISAPGMPRTAWDLGDRFGAMSGDFDALYWARFWATVYAEAFFAEDTEILIRDCLTALPPYSWAREIAETCLTLYGTYPEDWETSLLEIESMRREIFDCNNIQCSPDVNNGFALLAMLYGNNSYAESVRLASSSGYDADCTAATVGGVLGIMEGMDALPEELHTEIYRDGQGIYRNTEAVVPHFGSVYPETQTWEEIIDLYYSNAEKHLERGGSKKKRDVWYIVREEMPEVKGVEVPNGDFEDRSVSYAGASYGAGEAHDGTGYLEISGLNSVEIPVYGLTEGQWYELSAYVHTEKDNGGRISITGEKETTGVDFYDTIYQATPQMPSKYGFVLRKFLFLADSETMTISVKGTSSFGKISVDDITISEVYADYGEASHEMDAEFCMSTSELYQYFEIEYSNETDEMVKTYLRIDDEFYCIVGLPQTGEGKNKIYLPVQPGKGGHKFYFDSFEKVEGVCRLITLRYI